MMKTDNEKPETVAEAKSEATLAAPPCSASWPQGFSVTIGSRWQTKETPRLRGALFAADVTANSVSLQLEETEDFRGGLASKLAWVSTAQDLAEKWECLLNDLALAQRGLGRGVAGEKEGPSHE